MMKEIGVKVDVVSLGFSLASVSALCMLLLGILGNLGFYLGCVEIMMQIHLFFDLSFIGVVLGIIEGAVYGFVFGTLIAFFYNRIGGKNE